MIRRAADLHKEGGGSMGFTAIRIRNGDLAEIPDA
jgi:hypothetical protein